MKFGTNTNPNTLNFGVMFTCPALDRKNCLRANLRQKNQICLFEMKFGARIIWIS